MAEEKWLAFGAILWFFMNPQAPKHSIHDVFSNISTPNFSKFKNQNQAGLGFIIIIINGALECRFL